MLSGLIQKAEALILIDPKSAIRECKNIIATYNESFEAYNTYGVALFANNDQKEALEQFDKALKLNPADKDTLLNYVDCCKALCLHENALLKINNFLCANGNDEEINMISDELEKHVRQKISQNGLKFMQVHTFYDAYLQDFYKRSAIGYQSFNKQITALEYDYFSGSHIYTPYLPEFGYDCQLVIANAFSAQNAWLKDNNFNQTATANNMLEVVRLQVEAFKPDVLYLTDPITFDSKFISSLKHKPKFIFGFRAQVVKPDNDWSEFDLILSSHNFMKPIAEKLKARDFAIFKPAYPTPVNSYLDAFKPQYDVVFVGQLGGLHNKRVDSIKYLLNYFSTQSKYSLAIFTDLNNPLLKQARGNIQLFSPVFGREYYKTLKKGKICLNFHADIAGTEAGNMRMYEATGCGSFMLTDHFDNVDSMFKIGEELDTFKTKEEMIEKIEYYLTHDAERAQIAKAGQERCLKDYAMELNAQKLDSLIKNYLNKANQEIDKTHNSIEDLINKGQFNQALNRLSEIKSKSFNIPNADYLRGLCFAGLGQIVAARQAFLEELRFNPGNIRCQTELSKINITESTAKFNDSEFSELYNKISNFTMVGIDRLYSLFTHAKNVCQQNLPGNFVECGVAAGGTSALLAYVIKKYSKIPRLHYAFDSFEGMPEPTDKDIAYGVKANETNWGTGTCAAPIDSLLKICNHLGMTDIVKPVKGYFCDTLPKLKNEIGQIAFLHMDGDWYESTMDILNNLYDKVIDHGFIQIDDYGYWEGCRKAVTEYELLHNLKFELNKIDSTGVWLNKPISITRKKPIMLNLGCGSRWHEKWQNFDFISNSPQVKTCNLTLGIPVESNSADVVYHSHILEHFTKPAAENFIRECYRVLKPGGIIRIAVPDLEKIAEEYLKNLNSAIKGEVSASEKYDWTMLELYDQTVRNVSGGEMLKHWMKDPLPQKDYIVERMGSEVLNTLNNIERNRASYINRPIEESMSNEQIGNFRRGGEVHQWMYDRFSLSRLLANAGFRNIRVCKADESAITDFNSYLLDIEADGRVRKPDSLFMEAVK